MTKVDGPTLIGKLLQSQAVLLDVRSESEFDRGHLVGSFNAPILDDQHRHEVGLCYKHEGQKAAIQLGYHLTAGIRDRLIQEWIYFYEQSDAELKALTCWRGGLRSEIAQQWLEEARYRVVRVEGGYQALRRCMLNHLENLESPPFLVLTGATGTGKTELLQVLLRDEPLPFACLDLEELARHRGSVFGSFDHLPQPEAASFENHLAMQLMKAKAAPFILVEDESRNLGRCFLPEGVFRLMQEAPCIEVTAPMDQRIDRILDQYVKQPLRQQVSTPHLQQSLSQALSRLERRLGGQLYQQILATLVDAFQESADFTLQDSGRSSRHRQWIAALLANYYDRAYEFAKARLKRPILYRGEASDIVQWLMEKARG